MIIIPISWKQKTVIRNLPELLDNYQKHGGEIVEYRRIFSILVFSRWYPVFEWVPPSTTRQAAGRKHALWCFLLGWWSISGFFRTAGSVANNLMGGIVLTKVLTAPPGQPVDNTALQELQLARKRQKYPTLIFLLVLLLMALALVWRGFRKF